MDGMRLTLLGGFQATLPDRQISHFRTRKTAALLIYLVTEEAMRARMSAQVRGLLHDRQVVMAFFWPELDDAAAQNNLRQILFNLRHAIPRVPSRDGAGRVPLVLADRTMMGLNPEGATTSDVGEFLHLLWKHAARDCEVYLNLEPECIEMLEAATDLYRGDFLADYALAESQPFQEWVLLKEEYLRQLALKALGALTAAYVRRHDLERAATAARRQIRIDALHEPAYRQLMGVLALSGQRADALVLYDTLCRRLSDTLGVDPERATRELHQDVLREEVAWPCPPTHEHAPARSVEPRTPAWAGVGFTCP